MLAVFGPAASLVLFAGGFGALTSLHLIWHRQKENEALRAENRRLRESLKTSNLTFALQLVRLLGEEDGTIPARAAAAAVYAADLARRLGLDAERAEKVRLAALLRDVGLAGLPGEVLGAPLERLNPLGRRLYRGHPVRGEQVLAAAGPEFEEAAKWVRWHHERVDGTGYPDRLRAEWIPLEARILAVADAYVERILGGAGETAAPEARRALADAAGGALDGNVVRAFLSVLDAGGEDYVRAAGERFAFPDDARPETPGSGVPQLRVV
ncbi:HD-GYP domain-containing protein [Rubrobacter taiwanensis]|nr:HD domain-containing phosphohydrolase [Rubrobacter taiwanensis]